MHYDAYGEMRSIIQSEMKEQGITGEDVLKGLRDEGVMINKSTSEVYVNIRNTIQKVMKEKGVTYQSILDSIESDIDNED